MPGVARYAWEAAHLESASPVVHAVLVTTEHHEGIGGGGIYSHGVQVGQRNTDTMCRRKVGQRVSRYRRGGRVVQRPHVQLHHAEAVAHLPRCAVCRSAIDNAYMLGIGWQREEWTEPLPLFPAEPYRVEPGPWPAPYPDYYRWRVEPGGYWLPNEDWVDEMWPPGDEWHSPWEGVHLPTAQRLEEIAEQARAQERRALAQRTRLVRMQAGDEEVVREERRAMELLEDVAGTAAVEQLVQDGYVDVASPSNPQRGYRLRPWRRTGLLKRTPGGGWEERSTSLCAHPDHLYPSCDEIVGLWLRIRHDEEAFLETANLHRQGAQVERPAGPRLQIEVTL